MMSPHRLGLAPPLVDAGESNLAARLASGQLSSYFSQRRFETRCPAECVRPSDDELARLYSSCDAYVLPSIIEGLGAPPLQAMACGGAVVTTDCLGTRDFAVNEVNSLVVPPRDSAALSQAIVRVLTDDALSRELRKNGPGTAAPWTYERMESIFLRTVESG